MSCKIDEMDTYYSSLIESKEESKESELTTDLPTLKEDIV